jgi:hypothetical protein
MDATLTATQKAVETLKAAPFWLLIAICVCLFAILLVPTFNSTLPESAKPWVPLATFIATVLVACQVVSLIISRAIIRSRTSADHNRKRLVNLYRPLSNLFLTRHVTISTGINAPYLRYRIKNAWVEITSRQRYAVAGRRAFRALFDRQRSTSAEIEFGGTFPLTEIMELARANAKYADRQLLLNIAHADRSRYEEASNGLLTDDELALFTYIDGEHKRLSKKFC